jgi:phosphatidylglycerol:prolipoprotein diacylglycerol transferase
MWRVKKGEIPVSIRQLADKFHPPTGGSNLVTDFLLMSFFAALIGGRIGYVLLYNLPYFLAHPMAIISPYENGNFTGIYGMSYHGGLIGVALGSYIFLRIKKINPAPSRSCDSFLQQTKNFSGRCGINFWEWADFVIPAVPAGYFFGRVGNFLNGELYGRVTSSPLGMYFASDRTVLRWPSQLIEGFLEGIVLFVILWAMRKKEMPKGSLFAIYLIGYGFFRILAEIFREPDPQIGFLLNYFTLGQLLSFLMIVIGAGLLLKKRKV